VRIDKPALQRAVNPGGANCPERGEPKLARVAVPGGCSGRGRELQLCDFPSPFIGEVPMEAEKPSDARLSHLASHEARVRGCPRLKPSPVAGVERAVEDAEPAGTVCSAPVWKRAA
jgi:hypothetical protein